MDMAFHLCVSPYHVHIFIICKSQTKQRLTHLYSILSFFTFAFFLAICLHFSNGSSLPPCELKFSVHSETSLHKDSLWQARQFRTRLFGAGADRGADRGAGGMAGFDVQINVHLFFAA